MIHYVLREVPLTTENVKINALNLIEAEVNAFIKDSKVKSSNVIPMIEYNGTVLIVGAMINWELTPR